MPPLPAAFQSPQQQDPNTFTFSFRLSPNGGIEGTSISSPPVPGFTGVGATEGDMQGVTTAISAPADVQDQSANVGLMDIARRLVEAQQLATPNTASGQRSRTMGPQASSPPTQGTAKGKERAVDPDPPQAGPSNFSLRDRTSSFSSLRNRQQQAFRFEENNTPAVHAMPAVPAVPFRFRAGDEKSAAASGNTFPFSANMALFDSISIGGAGGFGPEKGAAAVEKISDSGYSSRHSWDKDMEVEMEVLGQSDTEMVER